MKLTAVAYKPDFIFGYLINPTKLRTNIGLSRMPNFKLSEKEALALTLYIVSLVPETLKQTSNEFTQSLENIKSFSPGISVKDGERIFEALNCTACHNQETSQIKNEKNAPDLSIEGSRVQKEWLKLYLKEPFAIRPFGNQPGSGSRMPDFKLSEDEIKIISDFLIKQQKKFFSNSNYRMTELNPFLKLKAEKLIEEKLPCRGCHEFKGIGGKIAPGLSSVSNRLKQGYVYEIISNPVHVSEEIIMPKVKMPMQNIKLITDYLNQMNNPVTREEYLSLLDNQTINFDDKSGAEKNYLKYCAPCHGVNGNSDGFNQQYLPTLPTRFNDKNYMQMRPNDTLYDGIFAGGYILNKSHLMPSWGFTLNNEEIIQLVKYLRKLCECNPPEWTTDN